MSAEIYWRMKSETVVEAGSCSGSILLFPWSEDSSLSYERDLLVVYGMSVL
jgi:hypothetical protein